MKKRLLLLIPLLAGSAVIYAGISHFFRRNASFSIESLWGRKIAGMFFRRG